MAYNEPITLKAPGSVISATGAIAELDVTHCAGVRFFVKTTATTGSTPTLDIKVQVYSDATGDWVDLVPAAAFAQITAATGPVMMTIYPGITTAANTAFANHIGRRCRLFGTIGGSGGPSFTYSVSATRLT